MIRTIKKIDLRGNEIWQDVIKCNRCKKILDPYESEWVGYYKIPKNIQTMHMYLIQKIILLSIYARIAIKKLKHFLMGNILKRKISLC